MKNLKLLQLLESVLGKGKKTSGDNVAFLYVKNLGTSSDQGLKLSLDNGSNYGIYIPPQGSVNLRGNSLRMDNVLVNKADENTQVEFIIAK